MRTRRKAKKADNPRVHTALKTHFGAIPLTSLATSTRQFPVTARLDLQAAIAEMLKGPLEPQKLLGMHASNNFDSITFSHLLVKDVHRAILIAPLQYDEIDIGEATPVRSLRNALWLCREDKLPFTLLLTHAEKFGRSLGLNLEITVPPGSQGLELSQRLMKNIERKVAQAGSYRGKVLSLE